MCSTDRVASRACVFSWNRCTSLAWDSWSQRSCTSHREQSSKQGFCHEEAGRTTKGYRAVKESGVSRGNSIRHHALRDASFPHGSSWFFLLLRGKILLARHGSSARSRSAKLGRYTPCSRESGLCRMAGSKNHHGDAEKKEQAINLIFFSESPWCLFVSIDDKRHGFPWVNGISGKIGDHQRSGGDSSWTLRV